MAAAAVRSVAFLLVLLAATAAAVPAAAQSRLTFYDEETTVRKLSFKFSSSRTFTDEELEEQIITTDPSFWDRFRDRLPLPDPAPHLFDPVSLQKDVVRLRRFYGRNGFLHPLIDYGASQLDTSRNAIHVILSIEEGPPLIIQDVGFFGPDSAYAFYQFPEGRREDWIELRDAITVQRGQRYTEYDRLRIQDQAITWLQDRGYAFARVGADATIDSSANTADLRFAVDPGPVAYIDSVLVEGNELVEADIIRREVPFKAGDRFSNRALVRGQRELFGLNLFRVALVNVVEDQPRDSTVTVRIRVREAQPRYVSAQTGYARDFGARLQGDWTHRNFLGGARNLTLSSTWNTGFLAPRSDEVVTQRIRVGLNLKQPFLFVTQLTGFVEPFYLWERNALREAHEAGLNTTLYYELLPFRYFTLRHTFSRVFDSGQVAIETLTDNDFEYARDFFNLSQFVLSGTLGSADDFVAPSRGYIIRPFAETAGRFLASDITYNKLGVEATAYRPLTPRVSINGRVFGGRIFLSGESVYDERNIFNAYGQIADEDEDETRRVARLENRFDPIRFYAGGGTDVRGWYDRELGPLTVRATTGGRQPRLLSPDQVIVQRGEDGGIEDIFFLRTDDEGAVDSVGVDFRREEIGGLAKLAGSLEFRLPFPGLGPNWSTAAFVDFGQVSEGSFNPVDFRYGVGGGLRYQTLVGFIRVDLGYKVNPDDVVLNDPADIWLHRNGYIDELDGSKWRRFALHLSIGQAF